MMPGPSCNTQAVFLVDISTLRARESKGEQAISLCIFRILNFLNSQRRPVDHKSKAKRKALRWGFKLFDLDEQIGRVESGVTGFQEFKLKSFQEFEKCLNSVSQLTQNPPAATKCPQGQRGKKASASSTYPAQCLSKRLTEALYDFQWEMPDIASPVKGRKWLSHEGEDNSNFVFLISRIPCDKQSLRHYCNKVVMDKDVFVESFMPQALRKQFYAQRKIRLHWIDTGRYQLLNSTETAPDQKSYDIVKQSLKSVGGMLIPFQSLVTHLAPAAGHPHQADGQTGDSRQADKGKNPLTVLLSSFACMSVCSALIPRRAGGKGRVPGPGRQGGNGPRHGANGTSVVLAVTGQGDGAVDVTLKVVPIVQHDAIGCQKVSDSQELALMSVGGSSSCCCLVRQTNTAPQKSRQQAVSRLEMRGCMEKSQVRQLAVNVGHHYLCVVAEGMGTEQQKAFCSLLQTIHSRQQTLILSVQVDSELRPYLAVLEASSTSSAQLSYLSLGITLQVEKVMALQGSTEKSDDLCERRSFQTVRDHAKKTFESKTTVQGAGDATSEGSEDGCNLWTGVLNPWHTPGSVPHLQSALDKLADRVGELSYLNDTEKAALQELKQAYRQENQPLLLPDAYHHSTPHLPSSSSFLPLSVERSSQSSREDFSGCESRSFSHQDSMLTRGQLMVKRAKSSAGTSFAQDEVDGEYVPPRSVDRPVNTLCKPVDSHTSQSLTLTKAAESVVSLGVSRVDNIKSEEDLRQFVQQQYEERSDTEVGMMTTVQSLVSVTQHYMATLDSSCPQKSAVEFLRETVLKSDKVLKSSYPHPLAEEDKKAKITELKLQVLLRLEMESVCCSVDHSGREQSADEVVELLRSLMFITDAGEVPSFLKTTVLDGYLATLPQLLVTVYDELMQPLPPALAGFTSPSTASSAGPTTLSVSSQPMAGPASSVSLPPGSNQSSGSPQKRTRSSVRHHPSLTGINNKRQILVETKVTRKAKEKKSKKGTKNRSKAEHKSPGKLKAAKKAKRNLFNTEPCSSASTSKDSEKPKTPKKKRCHSGSGKQKAQEENTTFVAETPRHHQRRRMSWQRAQVVEELSRSGPPDVQVIAESPLKDFAHLKSTPGRYKAPRRVLRQAFYSSGRELKSRNLTRALEKPENVSGQHHIVHLKSSKGGRLSEALKDKEGEEKLLSPRRQLAALLHSQLMKSPSPVHTSPAHFTRSKTPDWARRRRLFEDTRSMPAFTSAAKILDFTSPKKQLSTGASESLMSPPRTQRQSGGWLVADTPTKEEAGRVCKASSDRHGKLTKPTSTGTEAGGSAPELAAFGTLSKVAEQNLSGRDRGKLVGRRSKGVSPSQSSSSSSSQQSSILDYISPSRRPRSTTGLALLHSPSTPGRQAREGRQGDQVSDHSLPSAVSSPRRSSRHSREREATSGVVSLQSLLSPSRKLVSSPAGHVSGTMTGTGSSLSSRSQAEGADRKQASGSPFSGKRSYRRSLQKDLMSVSVQGSGQAPTTSSSLPGSESRTASACLGTLHSDAGLSTPTKTRQLLLSPVKSLSKTVLTWSSSQSQQFMSPTKTPTKPILKNSPIPRGERSFSGSVCTPQKSLSGPVRTPQKSPRVTFQVDTRQRDTRTPSPGPSSEAVIVKTPDSMSKWPRRKRRWSSEKSPVRSPSLEEPSDRCASFGSSGSSFTKSGTSLMTESSMSSQVSSPSGLSFPKKQSLLLSSSSVGNVSSPSKRQRKDGPAVTSVSKPTLFSEDAMDSYFSASNSNVFLATSAAEQTPSTPVKQFGKPSPHKRQPSPRFKGRSPGKTSVVGFEGSQGFDFATSSKSGFDSVGGSQGFEIVPSENVQHPHSPVFHTSPGLHRQTRQGTQRSRDQTYLSDHSRAREEAARTDLPHHQTSTGRQTAASATAAEPLPMSTRSAGNSPARGRLTPLRVKGMATDRKYSPSVSTTSLVQLMNSPILLEGPKRSKRELPREGSGDDSEGSPVKKRPRKKLSEMLG